MRTSRNNMPQVNAGSMADIAFLLLIFFLVTAVIPNDKGINRKLPELCPTDTNCNTNINQRNILQIHVNAKDELLVEGRIIKIDELKSITKNFLSNNGDGTCSHCDGLSLSTSSDNPKKAVISLQNDKQTSYEFYIKVQDQLTQAYYELRNTYANSVFDKPTKDLTKEELQKVRMAYPFILSEAELR
ncbi:biopolymer transporter ExbD [uncultured Psychroserpens sp.]|uniref:ExbD/TolR family protein n=1 Tax=uncultured Psychroserpens sp. TaxID=255436 RepID=UPI002626470A|nr:biopolymer transporter ExbD [uncultured Psychroserpens sp.]